MQQTFNHEIMGGQCRYCPEAGQLGGPAGPHGEEEQPRLKKLHSEAKLRIDNLTSAVSTLKIKYATPDELGHYQQCTKDLIISWVNEMETAVEAYIDEEDDEEKSEEVNDLMRNACQEAVDWLIDLRQAWNFIWNRKTLVLEEILVLEELRKNVDPFQ